MPARKRSEVPSVEDQQITEILEAMLSWRYTLDNDPDNPGAVVLWHESREPHPTLRPSRETVRRMHAEGWIRDREAKGARPHPLDFENLPRYYVTTKGYQWYLASQGLI